MTSPISRRDQVPREIILDLGHAIPRGAASCRVSLLTETACSLRTKIVPRPTQGE